MLRFVYTVVIGLMKIPPVLLIISLLIAAGAKAQNYQGGAPGSTDSEADRHYRQSVADNDRREAESRERERQRQIDDQQRQINNNRRQ